MSREFWRVYNYIARQWYETEYGASVRTRLNATLQTAVEVIR